MTELFQRSEYELQRNFRVLIVTMFIVSASSFLKFNKTFLLADGITVASGIESSSIFSNLSVSVSAFGTTSKIVHQFFYSLSVVPMRCVSAERKAQTDRIGEKGTVFLGYSEKSRNFEDQQNTRL